ncbi:MAG: hypothetical protein IKR18_10760 [Bacteroidaceae bacterium]|nr:hypothetical protein [Bacteroidaceae bacterium]
MKLFLLLLPLLYITSGCEYHRVPVDRNYKFTVSSIEEGNYMSYVSQDEYYAKWFEGCNSTTNFCVHMQVGDGFLTGLVKNISEEERIVHRGHSDLLYVMIYQGVDGIRNYFEQDNLFEETVERIEFLSPTRSVKAPISRPSSFRYKIPIPEDCVKILAISVAVEHMTFPEFNKCKGANELCRLFRKNIEYVRVEYFENVE